jgi:hypothetical protein
MEFFFIVLFLFLFALYFTKGKSVIVFLPAFLFVFDFGFQFLPTLSVVTYTKLLLILLSIMLYINRLQYFPIKSLTIFVFYILFLLLLSDEVFVSLKNTSKVLLSIVFLAVGFVANFKLNQLVMSLLILLIFAFSGSIIGYIFDIGQQNFYGSGEETMGLVQGGNFYPVSISLLFVVHLNLIGYWKSRFSKYIIIVISIATYILILLTLRRTAILLPVVGILAYLFFSGRLSSGVKYIAIIFISLLLSFPLYEDIFLRRFEIREESGRFDSNFYESEARYVTTLRTFEDIFSFKNPSKSLFGKNVFAGGWENGHVDRMYHADHNQLLNTTGIIGSLLYFLIFYQIIIFTMSFKGKELKNIKALIYSLLFILIFISLNGSIFITTFRVTFFLVLGYLMSFLRQKQIALKP